MKLNVDLSALLACVKQMGAADRDFNIERLDSAEIQLDTELSRGIEISLEDLDFASDGLLSYKGRQVLLYIPDQGYRLSSVIAKPETGRKFHIAQCKTLDEMRAKGRFERYVVTNDYSGDFNVFGLNDQGIHSEAIVNLTVCRNCLSFLNYDNYRVDRQKRNPVFYGFKILNFFEKYSTYFSYLPKENIDRRSGYPDNWSEISNNHRTKKDWTCEICKVNLANNKELLHTHHIDGNKYHNINSNLQALCVVCHRKQPFHENMYISNEVLNKIFDIRFRQGLLNDISSWDELAYFADSSHLDIANLLKADNRQVPQFGISIKKYINTNNVDIPVPLFFWPEHKMSVVRNDKDKNRFIDLGWKVITMKDLFNS